jgi:putative acetyltransferase
MDTATDSDTDTDTGLNTGPEHDYPVIRPERDDGEDVGAIHALTAEAFAEVAHASGTESAIIDALRDAGALTVSLVAVHAGRIVGHVAASPVTLDPTVGPSTEGWYGIGPLSVHPEFQRQGVGSALMRAVLDALIDRDATGAVLLGEPSLYQRFGFVERDGLTMTGLDPANASYFQALRLDGAGDGDGNDNAAYPQATVTYHPGFDAG